MSKNKDYIPYHKMYAEKKQEVDVPVEDAAQGEIPTNDIDNKNIEVAKEEPKTDASPEAVGPVVEEGKESPDKGSGSNNKVGVVVVDCKWLNVRPDPSTNNTPIFSLQNGDEVEILEDANDTFYKIYIKVNNVVGYTMKQYIKLK